MLTKTYLKPTYLPTQCDSSDSSDGSESSDKSDRCKNFYLFHQIKFHLLKFHLNKIIKKSSKK